MKVSGTETTVMPMLPSDIGWMEAATPKKLPLGLLSTDTLIKSVQTTMGWTLLLVDLETRDHIPTTPSVWATMRYKEFLFVYTYLHECVEGL